MDEAVPLSWNEIKDRALRFSRVPADWFRADDSDEAISNDKQED